MTRPLLICDCDEVLLHMVRHFGTWLRERHDIAFAHETGSFVAMTHADGSAVEHERIWGDARRILPRRDGAPDAGARRRRGARRDRARQADIVILTNLGDHCRDHRIAQLAAHGIHHRVETNRGGKGGPVAAAGRRIWQSGHGVRRRSARPPRIGCQARARACTGSTSSPNRPWRPTCRPRRSRTPGSTIGKRRKRWISPALRRKPARDNRRNSRMTDRIDRRLEEMGLTLPTAAAPVASYVPTVDAGGMLHISGQLPFRGRQGRDRAAGRRCRQGRGAGSRRIVRADAGRADQGGAGRRPQPRSSGSSSSACSSIRPPISPTSPRSPMAPRT